MAGETLKSVPELYNPLLNEVRYFAQEGLRYMAEDERISGPEKGIFRTKSAAEDLMAGHGLGGWELRWGSKIEPDVQDVSTMNEWDEYLQNLAQLRISSVPREQREMVTRRSEFSRLRWREITLQLSKEPPPDMQLDYTYLRTSLYTKHGSGLYVKVSAPGVDRSYDLESFRDDLDVHPLLEFAVDSIASHETGRPVPHKRDFKWVGRLHKGGFSHTRNPWSGHVNESGTVDIKEWSKHQHRRI